MVMCVKRDFLQNEGQTQICLLFILCAAFYNCILVQNCAFGGKFHYQNCLLRCFFLNVKNVYKRYILCYQILALKSRKFSVMTLKQEEFMCQPHFMSKYRDFNLQLFLSPFSVKKERDNRQATKNLNNIKEKRSNSFCVCECDRELSFLLLK